MSVAYEKVHYDRFTVLISNPGFQNLRTYDIIDGTVMRFELVLVARQTDGGERAMFRRVGLFQREGGPVQIHGLFWDTPETQKSNINIDVKYVLGASTLEIQVKNAGSTATKWSGFVNITSVR